ncbi:hypothetical protein [uncultured Ruminobacter sp.]|uniref:hypothetical protein n=1 Tax=uncultured Ruminobacter sp. TaxID=538947 RepID=UPI0025ED401B|nr:hypothetical protein [uncultured Ruminobacter sp.]
MSEKYYNPNNGTMFDSSVVDGIHKRYELRVKDAQSQVSAEFSDLKKLGKEIWRAQRFEDMVFGRFVIPTDLVNEYVSDIRIPKVLDSLQVATSSINRLKLTANHVKLGRIILNLSISDIIVNKDNFKLAFVLNSWEMPDTSWLIRNMIRIGMMVTGLEISAINRAIPEINVTKSEFNAKEYIVDLSPAIKNTIREQDLSFDMIRLLDWTVDESAAHLQISIKSEQLARYLKKRMPILFD